MALLALVGLDKDLLETLDSMPEWQVVGFFDAAAAASDTRYAHLGDDHAWAAIAAREPDLLVALAIDRPALRARLAAHYGIDRLATVIAPSARIAAGADVAPGCVLQSEVLVSRDAAIAQGCKINIAAQLHHDVRVGRWSAIAPGARLLGNVTIGERCFIGAGAVILPHCRVGADAIVGAGAVVTRDVAEGATVVGNPARPIRR